MNGKTEEDIFGKTTQEKIDEAKATTDDLKKKTEGMENTSRSIDDILKEIQHKSESKKESDPLASYTSSLNLEPIPSYSSSIPAPSFASDTSSTSGLSGLSSLFNPKSFLQTSHTLHSAL